MRTTHAKAGTAAAYGVYHEKTESMTIAMSMWNHMTRQWKEPVPIQRIAGESPITMSWWVVFSMRRSLTRICTTIIP